MLLEKLLFSSCLLSGMTRFQENKTCVEIAPLPGETILFFCIDNNSKGHSNCPNCGLRQKLWGKEEGQRICDLLVFYAKDDKKEGNKRVLCFVELKDNKSDLNDAVEQVINTYDAIKRHLQFTNEYEMKAFLMGHHGTPPIRSIQNQLGQRFGTNNYLYDGKASQFPHFLRGEETLNNATRKKKKQNRKTKNKLKINN
jgi:hypothetical protein